MEQYKTLCLKLRGHYQYYGIRSNYKMLEVVMEHAENAWRHWLSRRSNESYIPWDVFERLRRRFRYPSPGYTMPYEEPAGQQSQVRSYRRTGCLNWARPGLWGAWRATAGSTRNRTFTSAACPNGRHPRARRSAPDVI